MRSNAETSHTPKRHPQRRSSPQFPSARVCERRDGRRGQAKIEDRLRERLTQGDGGGRDSLPLPCKQPRSAATVVQPVLRRPGIEREGGRWGWRHGHRAPPLLRLERAPGHLAHRRSERGRVSLGEGGKAPQLGHQLWGRCPATGAHPCGRLLLLLSSHKAGPAVHKRVKRGGARKGWGSGRLGSCPREHPRLVRLARYVRVERDRHDDGGGNKEGRGGAHGRRRRRQNGGVRRHRGTGRRQPSWAAAELGRRWNPCCARRDAGPTSTWPTLCAAPPPPPSAVQRASRGWRRDGHDPCGRGWGWRGCTGRAWGGDLVTR